MPSASDDQGDHLSAAKRPSDLADDEFGDYLDKMLIGGREGRPIEIVAYDRAWPKRFRSERDRIRIALGPETVVHHVGSTAVEGLAAKPIIDIIVEVPAWSAIADTTASLQSAGYELRVREDDHLMFRTPARDVHVHLWRRDEDVRRHLVFTARLSEVASDRAEYEALKRQLATEEWPDMNYYARAKAQLIDEIVARAGREASGIDATNDQT